MSRLLSWTFPAEYAARAAEEEGSSLPRLPHVTTGGKKILPLFVLDSLLPGQRMFLHIFELRYRLLIQRAVAQHNRCFGMVGRLSLDDSGVADYGTEVEIVSCVELPDGRFRVAVQGKSIFRIVEKDDCDGYWEATVEDVDDDGMEGIDRIHGTSDEQRTAGNADDHDAITNHDATTRNLGAHVIRRYEEWEELIIKNNWERQPDQLKDVKSALGEMPIPEEERKLAIWVAAAINPLPPLGVTREIRPAILAAANPAEQLEIVNEALAESIERVRHKRGTVNIPGLGRFDVKLAVWLMLGLLAWWCFQGYIRYVVLETLGLESAFLGVFGVIATSSGSEDASPPEL